MLPTPHQDKLVRLSFWPMQHLHYEGIRNVSLPVVVVVVFDEPDCTVND